MTASEEVQRSGPFGAREVVHSLALRPQPASLAHVRCTSAVSRGELRGRPSSSLGRVAGLAEE
jgi:hypothetical protein